MEAKAHREDPRAPEGFLEGLLPSQLLLEAFFQMREAGVGAEAGRRELHSVLSDSYGMGSQR